MACTQQSHAAPHDYELRFDSLFRDGYSLAFPCDPAGHVELDDMTERARTNYFFARTVIGREFAMPSVRTVASRRAASAAAN